MKKYLNSFIYWTPRVLSLTFVAFLMIFSLDIFELGLDFWGTLVGLFIHNIPALILLIMVLISWKREIVGGITFIVAGFLYIILTLFREIPWYLALSWSTIIAGPAFLIGALYLIGWSRRKKRD
ncbi:MAG: hypothetical protein ABIB04_01670 [Patescibacteria group bacterium]